MSLSLSDCTSTLLEHAGCPDKERLYLALLHFIAIAWQCVKFNVKIKENRRKHLREKDVR